MAGTKGFIPPELYKDSLRRSNKIYADKIDIF